MVKNSCLVLMSMMISHSPIRCLHTDSVFVYIYSDMQFLILKMSVLVSGVICNDLGWLFI